VFLDRDGTLIEDRHYLGNPEGVVLLPGVSGALRRLADAGWARIVVTNQSGIGRGRFDRAAFDATDAAMQAYLAADGAAIDATYCCPHAPDAGCLCRKPGTALHREAAATWNIDLARSCCIGDRPSDVAPAREFGALGILVGAVDGDPAQAQAPHALIADNLAAAVDLLFRYL
jgi:D-glycero-D-manno-heptose 1,7-bisphosphate phosphatase